MIEFSLDARSGVSPYLQVVQQVRQALRLGLLREGDQLPTVKDVVARPGDQPEHGAQGLPRAGARRAGRRPAGGRHVRHPDADRLLAGRARAAAPGPARAGWPRRAPAGLDEESIEALFASTFRAAERGDQRDRRR